MEKRMIFQEEWKEYWNILFLKKFLKMNKAVELL